MVLAFATFLFTPRCRPNTIVNSVNDALVNLVNINRRDEEGRKLLKRGSAPPSPEFSIGTEHLRLRAKLH